MAKLEEGMEVCESCEVHENLLKIVNEKMPEETELYDLAELFKVFGDSTRMRILFVLFEAEVCVCDLAEALNMTQSAISHQLRILKQNKLVKSRREGKSVFYSLADDHVRTIVDQGSRRSENVPANILERVNFENCSVENALFDGNSLHGANFQNANMKTAVRRQCKEHGSESSGKTWNAGNIRMKNDQ